MVRLPVPSTGRALALDLGRRRIGVAVCDDARLVATPYRTVQRSGHRPDEHATLAALVEEVAAGVVVVGLPLSLDGSAGPAAKAVLSEVKALRRLLDVPVETHDERLSTVTAEAQLADGGVRGRQRRDVVDQVAAAVILQSWLDSGAGTGPGSSSGPNSGQGGQPRRSTDH
ncbi:MAG: Holliday junction resolvase RuvX [Actinomycetota bacterium]